MKEIDLLEPDVTTVDECRPSKRDIAPIMTNPAFISADLDSASVKFVET